MSTHSASLSDLALQAAAPGGLARLPRAALPFGTVAPAQRRWAGGAILGLHLLAVLGLLQLGSVREAVRQATPVFVSLTMSTPEPAPQARPAVPLRSAALPRPAGALPVATAPAPLQALPAGVAPAADPVAAPEPAAPAALPTTAAAVLPALPAVVLPAPPAASQPALPQQPKSIPASAVQYLVAPVVDYPRLSRRNGETGRVTVRAEIDSAGGAPRSVQVASASGHPRLDAAALAAVQQARFRPYAEQGRPLPASVLIPIDFSLER